ncbi:MAG TPA: hypothetical protein VM867_00605, partial [Xanthobacteraceae bacterium]|nr:hypothetical protein [Xanthobacteraceae bacterium]
MAARENRAEQSRAHWLATLEKFCCDCDVPGSKKFWSPELDTAPQSRLREIQDAKIAAVVPFLYENSPVYRRRFERFGLVPTDIR